MPVYEAKGTFQVGIELFKRTSMPILSRMFKNTNESFQMRHFMQFFPLGASKLLELIYLLFQIYLIKMNFFGNFNFDV